MQREEIHFTQERETLLITLYAKALESRRADSRLGDHLADEAVRRLDYPFAKLQIRPNEAVGLAIRAKQLDLWTARFLSTHPNATILHLGCGLDARAFRLSPPSSVQWFEIDFPDVIDLRRKLYPERPSCHLIGASVTDPDWLEQIPSENPAMIVAESLLPYLPGDTVKPLIQRLVRHFPEGEIAFDAYSTLGVKTLTNHRSIRATGASLRWGIDDPREIEAWSPGLRLEEEVTAYDQSQLSGMSPLSRAFISVWKLVPALRNLGRLLRYQF